jgi:hypothetical protein
VLPISSNSLRDMPRVSIVGPPGDPADTSGLD